MTVRELINKLQAYADDLQIDVLVKVFSNTQEDYVSESIEDIRSINYIQNLTNDEDDSLHLEITILED